MLITPVPARLDLNATDLILDGNSLVENMANSGNAIAYATLGGINRAKQNFGVGGQTTLNMLTDAVSQIDSQYVANKVLIVWEIRNHLVSGVDLPTALSTLSQYCLGRRSAGYRVLVIGCIPTTRTPPDLSPSFNLLLSEANRLIRRDWRNYCDGFVDVEAIAGLQNPADTSTYSDGIHLNAAGYSLLFPAVNLELSRLRR
jgi:hypothetical protein